MDKGDWILTVLHAAVTGLWIMLGKGRNQAVIRDYIIKICTNIDVDDKKKIVQIMWSQYVYIDINIYPCINA